MAGVPAGMERARPIPGPLSMPGLPWARPSPYCLLARGVPILSRTSCPPTRHPVTTRCGSKAARDPPHLRLRPSARFLLQSREHESVRAGADAWNQRSGSTSDAWCTPRVGAQRSASRVVVGKDQKREGTDDDRQTRTAPPRETDEGVWDTGGACTTRPPGPRARRRDPSS